MRRRRVARGAVDLAPGEEVSPGTYTVPPGVRPAWDWTPEHGIADRREALPWWGRIWYRTPLLDRFAYEWMWWHGGWIILARPPGAPAHAVALTPRP